MFTQNVESDDQFQQFYCQYISFVKRRLSIHVFPSLTEVLLYGVNKSHLLKCNRVEHSLLWTLHVTNKNMCTEAINTGSFKHLPKSITTKHIPSTTIIWIIRSPSIICCIYDIGARTVQCFDLHLLVDQISTMAKKVRQT